MKLDELKSQHPYVSFLFDLTGTLGYIASAGYAIPKLWLWFIAPITHLPAIGMVQALGLVIALSANDHLNAALAKVGIQALPTGKPFAFYCQSWGEDDWAILGEYPAASEAKVVIEQMWQVRIPVTVKGQHLAKEQETAGAGQPTL
jgi:hypothetical protein